MQWKWQHLWPALVLRLLPVFFFLSVEPLAFQGQPESFPLFSRHKLKNQEEFCSTARYFPDLTFKDRTTYHARISHYSKSAGQMGQKLFGRCSAQCAMSRTSNKSWPVTVLTMPLGGRFQQPANNHSNYGGHHLILFFFSPRLKQRKWQRDCEQAGHYELKYVCRWVTTCSGYFFFSESNWWVSWVN